MPPPLETDRLHLRPFHSDDVAAAYTVFEGHPDVWKFDPGYQRTFEHRKALIEKYAATNEPDGVGTLAVVKKEDDQLIGYVGLQLYVLPRLPFATPEVELYYKLGRDHWGQGYAVEACRAMIRFAFDTMRLQRIVTVASQENEASVRLMRRLGMVIEPAPPEWEGDVIGTLPNDHG